MKTTKNTALTVQNGTANAQDSKLSIVPALDTPTQGEAQEAQEAQQQPAAPIAAPEETQKPLMVMQRKGLGLEATLKVLGQLHRESIKRDNLLNRIGDLEAFEITLMEEADEMEGNHFQGCKLAIYDNKGRQFVTNTSGLIQLVAEFVKSACYEKLAEIEANLTFPQAA